MAKETKETGSKQYEWRCLDCDAKAPPTRAAGMEILKHATNHRVRLVDIENGKAVAASWKEAQSSFPEYFPEFWKQLQEKQK